MFPENLVQACFQQIQTVYTPLKPKNASAKAMRLTTAATNEYMYAEADYYLDVDEVTTAASRNLTGVAEEQFERSLKYADGINVLGQSVGL